MRGLGSVYACPATVGRYKMCFPISPVRAGEQSYLTSEQLSQKKQRKCSLSGRIRLAGLSLNKTSHLAGHYFSALSARMLSVEPLFDKTYLRIVFDESN